MSKEEELYINNERLVYRFATDKKILGNEDLIQDLKIALYNACCKYDETKGVKFSTYAYWAIINAYNYSFRSKDLKYQYVDNPDDYLSKLKDTKQEDLSDIAEKNEMLDTIKDYISSLPTVDRIIMYDRLIKDLSVDKISRLTQYDKKDILSVIKKHKKILQKMLKKYLQ